MEVKRKLQEDGLDPMASDEEKLLYLWQMYSKAQVTIIKTIFFTKLL